jgi:PTS system mannose-specific IIC component/fructoselysine and glucoselysine-specific PTS system IIC component
MLVDALLVALVLGIFKMEWIFGYPQICRPIVISTVTGLVLGNPVQGVIVGSALELMFIGSFAVGAAVTPDFGSAGAICTAFAILTNGGTAVASALAVPIALLGGFIFIGCKLMASFFSRLMSAEIEKDNMSAVSAIYLFGSWFVSFVPYFIYGFLSIYLGKTAVEALIHKLPTVVINGLSSATNLLPAIGFALLLQMIISKKMAPFFFIGFMLTAYLGLSTISVTLFAIMIVLIILSSQKNKPEVANINGGDDNEF